MVFEQRFPRSSDLRAHSSTSFSSCSSALLCQGDKGQARLCGEFQTVKAFCLIFCLLSFLLGCFRLVWLEAHKDGKDVSHSKHCAQPSQPQLASGYPKNLGCGLL